MSTVNRPLMNGINDRTAGWSALATPSRLLRWSIGCIYLWFGVLKLLDMSPATTLVCTAYPPFVGIPLCFALGLFEVVVGLLFLSGIWIRGAVVAAAVHLIGTFGTLILAPSIVFADSFPELTMEGEFVVKNVVLLAALYTIWRLEVQRVVLVPPSSAEQQ